jgi:competence protein ComGF
VEQQLRLVHVRLLAWKNLLTEKEISHHKILVSHTDHDMLSITLGMIFVNQVRLEKKEILDALHNVLDFAQERGLL